VAKNIKISFDPKLFSEQYADKAAQNVDYYDSSKPDTLVPFYTAQFLKYYQALSDYARDTNKFTENEEQAKAIKEIGRGSSYAFTPELLQHVKQGKEITLDMAKEALKNKGIEDEKARNFILALLLQNNAGTFISLGGTLTTFISSLDLIYLFPNSNSTSIQIDYNKLDKSIQLDFKQTLYSTHGKNMEIGNSHIVLSVQQDLSVIVENMSLQLKDTKLNDWNNDKARILEKLTAMNFLVVYEPSEIKVQVSPGAPILQAKFTAAVTSLETPLVELSHSQTPYYEKDSLTALYRSLISYSGIMQEYPVEKYDKALLQSQIPIIHKALDSIKQIADKAKTAPADAEKALRNLGRISRNYNTAQRVIKGSNRLQRWAMSMHAQNQTKKLSLLETIGLGIVSSVTSLFSRKYTKSYYETEYLNAIRYKNESENYLKNYIRQDKTLLKLEKTKELTSGTSLTPASFAALKHLAIAKTKAQLKIANTACDAINSLDLASLIGDLSIQQKLIEARLSILPEQLKLVEQRLSVLCKLVMQDKDYLVEQAEKVKQAENPAINNSELALDDYHRLLLCKEIAAYQKLNGGIVITAEELLKMAGITLSKDKSLDKAAAIGLIGELIDKSAKMGLKEFTKLHQSGYNQAYAYLVKHQQNYGQRPEKGCFLAADYYQENLDNIGVHHLANIANELRTVKVLSNSANKQKTSNYGYKPYTNALFWKVPTILETLEEPSPNSAEPDSSDKSPSLSNKT